MHVELRLSRNALRGWHVHLVHALDARPDIEVGVRWIDAAIPTMPKEIERFLAWDRALHRLPEGGFSLVPASSLADFGGSGAAEPDLILDLHGRGAGSAVPIWTVMFDGRFGELSAAVALLTGTTPIVSVVDVRTGDVLTGGHPGSERLDATSAALDDVLARTITLIQGALSKAICLPPHSSRRADPVIRPLDLAGRGLELLFGGAARRASRLLYRTPHWRVGWRFVDGPDTLDLLHHPSEGWRELPDDGYHFYADPFPVLDQGRTFVFVEDYDHRVGHGVISVARFDAHGPVEPPQPVLEHPSHLSYPFVIADGGQWWMIPETSSAGTVELYRACAFPEGWTKEAVLLEGIEANDVTVFRHGGRWWMAATVRDGGSSSDALHLWFAHSLDGPWTPHQGNPVLVDICAARPGGRVVVKGGCLIRPTQDGIERYGGSLTFAEITALDEETYAQRVIGRLEPGALWPGGALHTYNRAGRLECIDGHGRSSRF